MLNACSDN
jgi:hypothetical protein